MLCRKVYGKVVRVWSVIRIRVKDAVGISCEVCDFGPTNMEKVVDPGVRAGKGNWFYNQRVEFSSLVSRVGEVQFVEKGMGDRMVVVVPEVMVKVPSDNLGAVRVVVTLLQEKFTYCITLPLTRCHGDVM